jgi:hypothetical protein
MRRTNTKAIWALVAAALSFAALGALAYAARYYDELRVLHAVIAVPIAFAFGLASVVLNRRARAEHQRTLGRSGRPAFLAVTRLIGTIAFLLALTAALALAVFAVLVLVFE